MAESALPEGVLRAEEMVIDVTPKEKRIVRRTPTTRVIRAYQDYFDLGEGRSLKKLHEMYVQMDEIHGEGTAPTTSYGTLMQWSNKWQWQLQIRIDSGQIYQQRKQKRFDAVEAINERQSQASRILQNIAMRRLQKLVNEKGELTEEGMEISPSEARRMLLEGAKLERQLATEEEISAEFSGDELTYE